MMFSFIRENSEENGKNEKPKSLTPNSLLYWKGEGGQDLKYATKLTNQLMKRVLVLG
jgi:hypothetical protein